MDSEKTHLEDMLTESQNKALVLLRGKNSLFVSGPAGTGKSYLIDYYRKYFSPNTPIVASTGMAAILVGGRTFHSFFGLGTLNKDVHSLVQDSKRNFPLMRRIKSLKEVVIDEVSMLPGLALEMASEICKAIRGNDLPFGGIRVIFTGDFYQLPPVTLDKKIDWAFKTAVWKELNLTPIILKEYMRATETDFLEILKSVRSGNVSETVSNFLNTKTKAVNLDSFEGARLLSRKAEVDEYNQRRLSSLATPLIKTPTIYLGEARNVERLKKNLVIGEMLELKKGALVMVRINDRQGQYVNGSLGHVEAILEKSLLVELLSGYNVVIEKHKFELKDGDGKVIATAENFPVNLAYAITIHKSQGSTIDKALIDLRKLWDPGQAYTALSRLKTAEGLSLLGWDKKSIFTSQDVINFYQDLLTKTNN